MIGGGVGNRFWGYLEVPVLIYGAGGVMYLAEILGTCVMEIDELSLELCALVRGQLVRCIHVFVACRHCVRCRVSNYKSLDCTRI